MQKNGNFTRHRVVQFATLALTVLSCSAGFAQTAAPAVAPSPTPETKKADPTVVPPPANEVPREVLSLTSDSPYALVVDKEHRTLTIWKWTNSGPVLYKAFPTDIGRAEGDKIHRGDLRTPEGIYFLQKTYTGAQIDFSKYGVRAFVTNYPNFFDRLEHKTGSGIWLHAVPDTQTLWRGSRGCVVVRNDVIQEIAPLISLKSTPMIIEPEANYISVADWQKDRQGLMDWLDNWKKSWESQDIAKYISYYSEAFRADGMNKAHWARYKKRLNKKYTYIKVGIKNIRIYNHADQYIIRFLQTYESDKKEDFGEKTLYVENGKSGYQILGEDWRPRREAIMASGN